MSIGGSDIGFGDLVKTCVLVYNLKPGRDAYRKGCEKRIIDGGHPDLHLYVPGYSGFFNHDTTYCDLTTFFWWYPRNDNSHSNSATHLTRDLRRELKDLVQLLNNVISNSIQAANAEIGKERIHYVNMQPCFDGHRWCEESNSHEPDPNGKSWFFLSAWPDTTRDVSATVNTKDTDAEEIRKVIDAGKLPLPDGNSCKDQLESEANPSDVFMCDVAIDAAENPEGPMAELVSLANEDIANKNYTSESLSGLVPVRQIKTFHPRTAGMQQYRDAILEVMRAAKQFPPWDFRNQTYFWEIMDYIHMLDAAGRSASASFSPTAFTIAVLPRPGKPESAYGEFLAR
ncbi:SGNH hydrolase-type esterase domain-containing protein [Aspergillus filifer]